MGFVWLLFVLGVLGYTVFSYLVLHVCYEAGHDGDLTVPVSVAYMAVSLFFWGFAAVLLLNLQLR